jgi:hypothetical protein
LDALEIGINTAAYVVTVQFTIVGLIYASRSTCVCVTCPIYIAEDIGVVRVVLKNSVYFSLRQIVLIDVYKGIWN